MAVPLDTVGVFVGGTAGIREFALKAFAQRTTDPKIYIVGRNGTAAATIAEQVKELNPESEVVFIKADTSLLANVDAVCKEIQSKEDMVNFLFVTTGSVSFKSRDEKSEGSDRKLSLTYYSRMRFVHNLLPELTAASKEPNSLSRMVTVLLRNCHYHANVMNDFGYEELAKQHPGTAFVHLFPGYA
ncbi:hypothetical protein MMC15_002964 [Xylographa vitiligo]|nr:hypothetical protein [Xylographa vitiligo]